MKDITILSLEEAILFDPLNNTFMIRILGPEYVWKKFGGDFPRLLHSERFMKTSCYEFDDVTPWEKENLYLNSKLFESGIAEKMIRDFEEFVDITDYLVVHCFAGVSRSSAVASALNHIFDLRVRDESFLFPGIHSPNMYVYNTMIQTARGLGKVFPFCRSGDKYFV